MLWICFSLFVLKLYFIIGINFCVILSIGKFVNIIIWLIMLYMAIVILLLYWKSVWLSIMVSRLIVFCWVKVIILMLKIFCISFWLSVMLFWYNVSFDFFERKNYSVNLLFV